MINQYKISFVVKTLMVVLTLVVAGSVMAAWQDPPTQGPPPAECPAGIEGCNPPVNTGTTAQAKRGSLLIEGFLSLIRGRYIDFASNLPAPAQRNANAGKMGYQLFGSRNALDIVGAGMASSNRLVKIWDILDVQTASTTNIYARNYYVCTASGSCSPFTGGGSQWTDVASGMINYAGSRVGIRSATPLTTLDVRGNAMVAGSGSRLVLGGVDPANNLTWQLDQNSGGTFRIFSQPNLNTAGTVRMNISPTGATTFGGSVTASGDICTTVTGTSKCLSTGGSGSGLPAGVADQTLRYNSATNSWVSNSFLSNSGSRVIIGTDKSLLGNNVRFDEMGLFSAVRAAIIDYANIGAVLIGRGQNNLEGDGTTLATYKSKVLNYPAEIAIAGTSVSGPRKVSIYDNLNVNGTTSTRSLEICNAAGACSPVLPGGGSSQWLTNGQNIYNGNTGNVGIGLNTPTKKLDISTAVSSDGLRLRRTNNTGFSLNMGNAHPWIDFTGGLDFIVDSYGNIGNWRTGKGADTVLSLDATNKNVGVGTASPAAGSKLDVAGSITGTGLGITGSGIFTNGVVAGDTSSVNSEHVKVDVKGFFLTRGSGARVSIGKSNGDDPATSPVWNIDNYSGVESNFDFLRIFNAPTVKDRVSTWQSRSFMITPGGRVGLGIPPTDVGNSDIRLNVNGKVQATDFCLTAVGGKCLSSLDSNNFWSSNTNGIHYTDLSRRVGIGTNNPGAKLDVIGDLFARPTASGIPVLTVRTSAGNQNVGIGTDVTSASAKLEVAGNVRASGDICTTVSPGSVTNPLCLSSAGGSWLSKNISGSPVLQSSRNNVVIGSSAAPSNVNRSTSAGLFVGNNFYIASQPAQTDIETTYGSLNLNFQTGAGNIFLGNNNTITAVVGDSGKIVVGSDNPTVTIEDKFVVKGNSKLSNRLIVGGGSLRSIDFARYPNRKFEVIGEARVRDLLEVVGDSGYEPAFSDRWIDRLKVGGNAVVTGNLTLNGNVSQLVVPGARISVLSLPGLSFVDNNSGLKLLAVDSSGQVGKINKPSNQIMGNFVTQCRYSCSGETCYMTGGDSSVCDQNESIGSDDEVTISCRSGYTAIAGGGSCGIYGNRGRLEESIINGDGWRINCDGRISAAYVACVPK